MCFGTTGAACNPSKDLTVIYTDIPTTLSNIDFLAKNADWMEMLVRVDELYKSKKYLLMNLLLERYHSPNEQWGYNYYTLPTLCKENISAGLLLLKHFNLSGNYSAYLLWEGIQRNDPKMLEFYHEISQMAKERGKGFIQEHFNWNHLSHLDPFLLYEAGFILLDGLDKYIRFQMSAFLSGSSDNFGEIEKILRLFPVKSEIVINIIYYYTNISEKKQKQIIKLLKKIKDFDYEKLYDTSVRLEWATLEIYLELTYNLTSKTLPSNED